MVNPLRIMSQGNWADSAVVTATSGAVSSLPASHLLDDDIKKIWRSGGTAPSDTLIIDLAAQREIGAVALINTNMTSGDTIYVRVSNSDPTGIAGEVYSSGTFASGVDPAYAKFVHFIEPAVFGRYIRIAMFIPDPEAGRLVVCPVWAPSRDRRPGAELLWEDPSVVSFSIGGNEFVDQRQTRRGHRFQLKAVTELEALEQVTELNRLRGTARDILVCLNKDTSNFGRDTLWGRMAQPARMSQNMQNFYTVEFEVWDRN